LEKQETETGRAKFRRRRGDSNRVGQKKEKSRKQRQLKRRKQKQEKSRRQKQGKDIENRGRYCAWG